MLINLMSLKYNMALLSPVKRAFHTKCNCSSVADEAGNMYSLNIIMGM